MPVKFVKTPPAEIAAALDDTAPVTLTVPKDTSHLSPLQVLVDEVGALTTQVADLKKLEKLLEAKKETLKAMMGEDLDADKDRKSKGDHFIAVLSAQGNKREVTDLLAVMNYMGMEQFMKLATVKLTDLDKYLTPAQLAACVTTTASGPRTLKLTSMD